VGRRVAGAVAVAAHGMCPAARGGAWVHVRACALCGDKRRRAAPSCLFRRTRNTRNRRAAHALESSRGRARHAYCACSESV